MSTFISELEEAILSYNDYKPVLDKYGVAENEVSGEIKLLNTKRASILLDKLPETDSALPLKVRRTIQKLQLILFTADRLLQEEYNVQSMELYERIDNYLIAIQLLDYSRWSEEPTIIEDRDLQPIEVVLIERHTMQELEKLAKTLHNKMKLKDNIKEYVDRDRFFKECEELGFDPMIEDEMTVHGVWEEMQ